MGTRLIDYCITRIKDHLLGPVMRVKKKTKTREGCDLLEARAELFERAEHQTHRLHGHVHLLVLQHVLRGEREFFIDNLPVRIHFIIVMIRWTGLAPWEFEFPFSSSHTSTFLVLRGKAPVRLRQRSVLNGCRSSRHRRLQL